MKVTVLTAIAANNVIGVDGTMAWHDADELRFFKDYTMSKYVVVGSNTFRSMPLSVWNTRKPIVVTRDAKGASEYAASRNIRLTIANSVQDAVTQAMSLAAKAGDLEVIVAGGASIYLEALRLPEVTHLVVSDMHHNYQGDVLFPMVPRKLSLLGTLRTGKAFTTFKYALLPELYEPQRYPHSRFVPAKSKEVREQIDNWHAGLHTSAEFMNLVAEYELGQLNPDIWYGRNGIELAAGAHIPTCLKDLSEIAKECARLLGGNVRHTVSVNGIDQLITGAPNRDPAAEWQAAMEEGSRKYGSSPEHRSRVSARMVEASKLQARAEALLASDVQTLNTAERIRWLAEVIRISDQHGVTLDRTKLQALVGAEAFTRCDDSVNSSRHADFTSLCTAVLSDLSEASLLHPIYAAWLDDFLKEPV